MVQLLPVLLKNNSTVYRFNLAKEQNNLDRIEEWIISRDHLAVWHC